MRVKDISYVNRFLENGGKAKDMSAMGIYLWRSFIN